MAYVTRTHVDPGDPIASADGNQSMDNEEYLKARTDYFAVQLQVVEPTLPCFVGDGQAYLPIPQKIGGMDLKRVHAKHITAGTTGTMLIQVRNVTQAVDMLSTRISTDSGELGSDTAAAPAVIDTANDDVAAFDTLAIDVDQLHTTPALGLVVTLEFG